MGDHFYSSQEIGKYIQNGVNFHLVEPLFDERQNVLIGTEKILTTKDLEKIAKRKPELLQKPLHVQNTIPHFISEEQRVKWVAYILSLFTGNDIFKKLPRSTREFVAKYVKSLLVEEDYVIWKLSQLKKFSKKIFVHSVITAFIALIAYLNYNQEHFQGMIDATMVVKVIQAAFLHDIGFLEIDLKLAEKKRYEVQDNEKLKYYQHPIYGFNIIKEESQRNDISNEVKEAILNHEERIDGNGAPRGLSGDDLSFLTNLIAIANYFSLLIEGEWSIRKRPYRDYVAKLRMEKKKFDPKLLAVLDNSFKYLFQV